MSDTTISVLPQSIVSVVSNKILDKFSVPPYRTGRPSRPMEALIDVALDLVIKELIKDARTRWTPQRKGVPPEERITDLAVLLAAYEKMGSQFGKVALIWATAVLLGGLVTTLKTVDFWFVSILLVIEGYRIFSRSQLLLILNSKSLLSILIFVLSQILPAVASIVLCFYRLSIGFHHGGSDTITRNLALRIFYYICPIGAGLVLLGQICGIALVENHLLSRSRLVALRKEYDFDDSLLYTAISGLFYAVYSRFLQERNSEATKKMDFPAYGVELLQSSNYDDALTGARVLQKLANSCNFAEKTLRTIGTGRDVMEKLMEMLNWENPDEQEIRIKAAEIISKLVERNPNHIRVTAIAGSIESIASFLYDSNQITVIEQQNETKRCHILALRILKSLAKDYNNSKKIRSNRDLVSKIRGLAESTSSENETAKLAKELVQEIMS